MQLTECLYTSFKAKKNILTNLMDENPLVSDGKQCPSSLVGNADNLLENFDARVNIFLSMTPPPFLVWKASDAILKVTVDRVLQ